MQQLEHYFTHSLFSVEFRSSGERDLAMKTIAVDANCSSVCVSLCVSHDENIPLSLSLLRLSQFSQQLIRDTDRGESGHLTTNIY